MWDELFNSNYLHGIGIMGGTFNPLHYGHLMCAETVREEYGLDKIVFIPSSHPPHKNDVNSRDKEHRYLMAVAATLSNPYFEVSRIEIDREGYSYTVDTIAHIREMCGKTIPLYFITGADAFLDIPTWKHFEKLLGMCNFIAVTRPGFNERVIKEQIHMLKKKYNAKISLLEVSAYDISSSDIRQRVSRGKSIEYYVPEPIKTYIHKNGMYREYGGIMSIDYNALMDYLKSNLSPYRQEHTKGVAEAAVKLANLYGADEDKAYIAALLHDIAKELPLNEKIALCKEYGVVLDDIMLAQPELIHSFLGAEIAKALFGIKEDDILNAIRYHTTGRAAMTKLEKIILLADMVDVSRGDAPEIAQLRKVSEKNLNKAVILSIKLKIESPKKKKLVVHPLSLEALDHMENIGNLSKPKKKGSKK